MRIFIFEEDSYLLSLLSQYLEENGHQVSGFSSKYSCPVYQLKECACSVEYPCADAVIINTTSPDQKEVKILINQDERGCKISKFNKSVTSANINKKQEQQIREMGYKVITKPFRLSKISEWLKECKVGQKTIDS